MERAIRLAHRQLLPRLQQVHHLQQLVPVHQLLVLHKHHNLVQLQLLTLLQRVRQVLPEVRAQLLLNLNQRQIAQSTKLRLI